MSYTAKPVRCAPTDCVICGKKDVHPTILGKYRKHTDQSTGEPCDASGTYLPGCVPQRPDVPLTPGLSDPTETTDAAPSASPPMSAGTTASGTANDLASSTLEGYRGAVPRQSHPFSQPGAGVPTPAPAPVFQQPARVGRAATQALPMTDLGKEVTARLKEMFFAYTNRSARSQQATLGPSQIGSPCDRRLAMSLLRVGPVNPGGDNWASFVGTQIHAGLAEMFEWANAGTGRYAVEMPLTFPSKHVPRGTGDLLDRVLCMFDDHKAMGLWSRDKLKTWGPSDTYRIQVHTYALGARLKGEKVDHVAIIGWPRDASNLDDLYVWTEPYDPTIARNALARVERIAADLVHKQDHAEGAELWRSFPAADDCRFCPFHLAGDKHMQQGCPGR